LLDQNSTLPVSGQETSINKAVSIKQLLNINILELGNQQKKNGGRGILTNTSKKIFDGIQSEEWGKLKDQQNKLGLITP